MRSILCLAISLSVLLGACDRKDAEQRTVPESAVEEQEAQKEQEEREADPEPSEPTSEVPADLLKFVHSDATSIGWVDLDAFRAQWVGGFVGGPDARQQTMARAGRQLDLLGNDPRVIRALGQSFRFSRAHEIVGATGASDSDWIVVSNDTVLTEETEPRRINSDSEVRIGRRDGYVIFGQGELFERAIAGISEEDRYVPTEEWEFGWDTVPEEPALLYFSSDFGNVPEVNKFRIPVLEQSRADRVAISGSIDGSLLLSVENEEEKAIRQLLGAAYAFSTQASALDAEQLPQFLKNWSEYTRLVTRSIWSRLRIERGDDLTTFELIAPSCGRPIRNLIPAIGIAGAVYQVLEEGTVEGAELFDGVEAPVADDCDTFDGPGPQLPVEAVRATAEGQHFSALALADYGALFRDNLTSAFGILPYALEKEAVRASFADEPLGLDEGTEQRARLAFYVEKTHANEAPGLFIAAPEEAARLLPDRVASTAQEDEILGRVAATPNLRGRYLTGSEGGPLWQRAVDRLPEDTVFAVIAPELVFDAFASQLELPEETRPWLRAVRSGTLLIGQDLSMSFLFEVDEGAEEIAADLEPFVTERLEQALTQTDAAQKAHRGGMVFSSLAKLLTSEVSMEATEENVVRVSFGAYGKLATGILSSVSIYSAMVRLQVIEGGWPSPELQLTPSNIQRQR